VSDGTTSGGRASGVRVRAATLPDVEAVARIEQASFGDPWSRAAFVSLVGNPAVYFIVAELTPSPLGVGVAGYLIAWFVLDEAEIANVAVSSALRGHGVGGRLLDVALAEARHRGVERTFLEVRASNTAAQALYASRGFAAIGRRRNYYLHPVEDALVLRRVVPGAPPP
jgi:ribosomal-protein-alanine N-acetyltransferase